MRLIRFVRKSQGNFLSLIKLGEISVLYEVSAPNYKERNFLDLRKKD